MTYFLSRTEIVRLESCGKNSYNSHTGIKQLPSVPQISVVSKRDQSVTNTTFVLAITEH